MLTQDAESIERTMERVHPLLFEQGVDEWGLAVSKFRPEFLATAGNTEWLAVLSILQRNIDSQELRKVYKKRVLKVFRQALRNASGLKNEYFLRGVADLAVSRIQNAQGTSNGPWAVHDSLYLFEVVANADGLNEVARIELARRMLKLHAIVKHNGYATKDRVSNTLSHAVLRLLNDQKVSFDRIESQVDYWWNWDADIAPFQPAKPDVMKEIANVAVVRRLLTLLKTETDADVIRRSLDILDYALFADSSLARVFYGYRPKVDQLRKRRPARAEVKSGLSRAEYSAALALLRNPEQALENASVYRAKHCQSLLK